MFSEVVGIVVLRLGCVVSGGVFCDGGSGVCCYVICFDGVVCRIRSVCFFSNVGSINGVVFVVVFVGFFVCCFVVMVGYFFVVEL